MHGGHFKYNDEIYLSKFGIHNMPCKGTANYQDSYCDTLADISVVIRDNAHRWLILGGDLNFDFASSGPLHDCIFEFASCCKLQLTYNLLPSLSLVSYRHQSLLC